MVRKTQPISMATGKDITRLVFIFLAIALIFSIAIGLVAGLGIYFYIQNINAPVQPIEKQLKALNKGEINLAYEKYTSAAFKRRTSLQEFTDLVQANPQIFKSKSSNFDNVDIRNNQATVSGTINGQDGTVTPMTYRLVFEKDEWRILGFKQGA